MALWIDSDRRNAVHRMNDPSSAQALADELSQYIVRSVERHGGSTLAVNPGNRVIFDWPPHPESYGFHLHRSDWTEQTELEIGEETFLIEIADSQSGLFGRIPELWFEARGRDLDQLKANLSKGVEPLLERQRLIAQTLEQDGRFVGHINLLKPIDLLKLLYCPDRDVVNDGRREIETHASSGVFFPALLVVLQDRTQPYRRSAQWAVLDMFEDLNCFARQEEEAKEAVAVIKDVIWDAEDDYARTIFKAGVVLGGHVSYRNSACALLECLSAPSKIGRRSAIHGLYHLAEWAPEHRQEIIDKLEEVSLTDIEPQLREYAAAMAVDIQRADTIHVEDIYFNGEVW